VQVLVLIRFRLRTTRDKQEMLKESVRSESK
jgi:hypothetical protein